MCELIVQYDYFSQYSLFMSHDTFTRHPTVLNLTPGLSEGIRHCRFDSVLLRHIIRSTVPLHTPVPTPTANVVSRKVRILRKNFCTPRVLFVSLMNTPTSHFSRFFLLHCPTTTPTVGSTVHPGTTSSNFKT